MDARIETDFTEVRRSCADLFAAGAAESFFLAPWWWQTMIEAGMPDGMRAEFLVVRERTRPVLLWALQRGADPLAGLSGPYSCLYRPLLAPEVSDGTIAAAARVAAKMLRRDALCRLDGLDSAAAWLPPFIAGLGDGGLQPLRFDHFGVWHEAVAGLGWVGYMARRPGELRETVRRRLRRAAGLSFEIISGEGLAAAHNA